MATTGGDDLGHSSRSASQVIRRYGATTEASSTRARRSNCSGWPKARSEAHALTESTSSGAREPSTPVRIGVIGAGGFASFVADALDALDDVRLLAVVD